MKNHLKNGRCQQPLLCEKCGVGFKNKSLLDIHIKMCNNIDNYDNDVHISNAEMPGSPLFDASDKSDDDILAGLSSDRDETVEVTVPVTTVSHPEMVRLERASVRENLLHSLEEGNLDNIVFFMEQDLEQDMDFE